MAEYRYTDRAEHGEPSAHWTPEKNAAWSMRERAADAVVQANPLGSIFSPLPQTIRALPLLPNGGDTAEVAHSGYSQPASEQPTEVHVATPEGITPCGRGHHDVTVAALIDEVTCLECLRTLAQLNGTARPVTDYEGADCHDPTVCTDLGCLACRMSQLERDMRHVERAFSSRLDALEIAESERTQSAGAPRAQVAGGGFAEEEHRYCGATIDRFDGTTYTCARRVAHEGGCGPKRVT
ncbi:hypothetical protein [Nocardiopsis sp. JB363]|uniref:hypothetical protein n=1 Tax=Nocardiopsis sp. JB363 TaxID=1434837 RepID=UPI00097A3B08|nr:hypothetical protein [Nocardiopsis sp. JB363]SIO86977.1 hypothetical protein BQ8420_14550 [Nocardiopsis sp. JB363]